MRTFLSVYTLRLFQLTVPPITQHLLYQDNIGLSAELATEQGSFRIEFTKYGWLLVLLVFVCFVLRRGKFKGHIRAGTDVCQCTLMTPF